MTIFPRNPVEFFRQSVLPRLTVETVYAGVSFQSKQGRYWRAPCPLHGGKNPSAFSVDTQTLSWTCWSRCGSGSVLAFVNGGEEPRGVLFVEAVKHLAELAGVEASDLQSNRSRPWLPSSVRQKPPSPPAPLPSLKRPPASEINALWEASQPVCAEPEASSWLKARGLESYVVSGLELARVLPQGFPLSRWARYRGRLPQVQSWAALGHRLLLPCYGPTGQLESIRARCIGADSPAPKSLPPAGYSTKGLVMADSLGRHLLKEGRIPSWWDVEDVGPLRLIIVEGEPDYLTWATRFSDSAEYSPAVWGIMSGSWTEQIAARIPSGTRVIIRTDHDHAGEKYAALIYKSLATRCKLMRAQAQGNR